MATTEPSPEFLSARAVCRRLFAQAAQQPLSCQSWTYWYDEAQAFIHAARTRDTEQLQAMSLRLRNYQWDLTASATV